MSFLIHKGNNNSWLDNKKNYKRNIFKQTHYIYPSTLLSLTQKRKLTRFQTQNQPATTKKKKAMGSECSTCQNTNSGEINGNMPSQEEEELKRRKVEEEKRN